MALAFFKIVTMKLNFNFILISSLWYPALLLGYFFAAETPWSPCKSSSFLTVDPPCNNVFFFPLFALRHFFIDLKNPDLSPTIYIRLQILHIVLVSMIAIHAVSYLFFWTLKNKFHNKNGRLFFFRLCVCGAILSFAIPASTVVFNYTSYVVINAFSTIPPIDEALGGLVFILAVILPGTVLQFPVFLFFSILQLYLVSSK